MGTSRIATSNVTIESTATNKAIRESMNPPPRSDQENGTDHSILKKRKSSSNSGKARKSIVISIPGTTTGQKAGSEKTQNGAIAQAAAKSSDASEGQPRMTRARSIVMMGSAPVALLMKSEADAKAAAATERTERPSLAAIKLPPPTLSTTPPPPPPPTSNEKQPLHKRRRGRTFRIWAPNQDRKSILVKVGGAGSEEADKIFEAFQMRQKNFGQWRKQAKSQLPSVAGGAPVENLTDVINIAPALKKEDDPRNLHKAIRRLSIDTDEMPMLTLAEKKRTFATVDYTKVREVKVTPDEEDDDDDYDDDYDYDYGDESDDEDEESNEDVVIDVSSDEEERELERRRKEAGKDIKEKMKTLKELAEHLSDKRKIRQTLVQRATGFVLLDTEQIPLKEHLLYLIEDCSSVVHDFVDKLVIWKKPISEINGRYGVVTASYFIWLRRMIALELFLFFSTAIMVIIPQIVEDISYDAYHPEIPKNRPSFSLGDLINGEGYLHHSYMYYTGYQSRNEDAANPLLNPAFRFIICKLFVFFVLTYFIFSRLTKYYQSIRMESKVSSVAHMEHFKAIVCGWDFGCHDSEAKVYLHKTICRELYILARQSDKKNSRGSVVVTMEMGKKKILAFAVKHLGLVVGPWAIYIFINFLLAVACVVLGVVLVYLCQLKLFYYVECVTLRDDLNFDVDALHHNYLCPSGSQELNTTILSLPALFASIATLLLTKLILFVGDNEVWYNPERKIYATMIRSGLLYFTFIGVFYTFWIRSKNVLTENGFVAETIFGKELYRLVVIQGVIDVVLNVGFKGTYHLIRRKRKGYVLTEFRTEYCSLSMFFIHSVSRIGTLVCPPLSIFVILRLVLDFYQNKFALFHLSAKETYSTHASHVYAPFLLTFFILCYLITSFMNVYYINSTVPSQYNGPFVKYNVSYDEVLGLLLTADSGIGWLRNLATPGFLVTFNAILGGVVYFCRDWGQTYEPIIDNLNNLINEERADRDLLLVAIFEIAQVTPHHLKGDAKTKRIQKTKLFQAISSTASSRADSGGEEDQEENVKTPVIEGAEKDFDRDGKVVGVGVPESRPPASANKTSLSGAPDPTVIQMSGTPLLNTTATSSGGPSSAIAPSLIAQQSSVPRRSILVQQTTNSPRPTVASTGARVSIMAPLSGAAAATVVVDKEKTIEEQIRDVIRQVKTRRRTQPDIDMQKPPLFTPPPPNIVDRKEVEERQKALKAQEEKAMQKGNQQLNTVLGNVIENRKRMMMLKGTTAPSPSKVQQQPVQGTATANQQKTQKAPQNLQQQIQELSVIKVGEVSSYANTAKKRISTATLAKSKPGGAGATTRKR